MTGIDIREARPRDVVGLVSSVASLFADEAGTREHTLDRPPRQRAATELTLGIADEDRLVLVAADGDQIVGHLTGTVAASAAIRPLRVATLVGMYVSPAHRDANVGARLVAAFRAWAAERHADRIALDGYRNDESAVRFHRHQRFAPRTPVLETTS
ncbi:GNAT family N-acetyltransferase [Catellatospora methionotrophica]|uniref:GNAT family N-acetyltransferase n=1 Tax=Catellatospora methionotrophica TaxID=121620 RepID=UPI0033C26A7C